MRDLPFALLIIVGAMCVFLTSCRNEPEVETVPLALCMPGQMAPISGDGMPVAGPMRAPFHPENDNDKPTFYPYNELYPVPINKNYTTIGAFLVQDTKDTYTSTSGVFRWESDNSWTTTVGIRPGDFYLFGYMPSNVGSVSAKIDRRGVSWANGCVMTISNLSTVTPADVCVVIGVLKADVEHGAGGDSDHTPGNHTIKSIDDPEVVVNLQQGQYAYTGTDKDNFVYLLLDHLYTNVNMELSVEAKYAQLRTIVLTEVYMKTPVRNTVDVVVTLGNDATHPIEDISIDAPTGLVPTKAQIFPALPEYKQVVAVEGSGVTSIPGYFAPGLTTQEFEFEFHYSVYDKEGEDLSDPEHPIFGNCVRENCVAINKWTLPGTGVQNGKSFRVTATIRPTYLFMLSDPDLDNPTVVLHTEPNP